MTEDELEALCEAARQRPAVFVNRSAALAPDAAKLEKCMQLKTVTVTFQFVIAVKDGISMDARRGVVLECVKEAFSDNDLKDIDFGTKPYVPGKVYGWDDECIPYGGDGNTTIGQYLAGQKP